MAKKKSSKQKGAEWEREFAMHMESELGFDETILNYTVKGKTNTNEYEIDIVGKKLSENGENMKTLGYILIAIGVGAILLYLFEIIDFMDDTLIICGVLAVVGGIALEFGKKNLYEYTWVECKNHSVAISKTVLNDLRAKADDYHNLEANDKKFKDIVVASKNGFAKNVSHFAKEYGILLYEKQHNIITEIKLKTI